MFFLFDPQFGTRMITLMAAFMLVLQIAMVGQRMLVTNVRLYAVQSLLLASIAATIAWFNREPHVYVAAVLTLLLKVVFLLAGWSGSSKGSASSKRFSLTSMCPLRS